LRQINILYDLIAELNAQPVGRDAVDIYDMEKH